MAQNFFENYQTQMERRNKPQKSLVPGTPGVPDFDPAVDKMVQKRLLARQPQFQPTLPDRQPSVGEKLLHPWQSAQTMMHTAIDPYASQPSMGGEVAPSGPSLDIAHKGAIGGPLSWASSRVATAAGEAAKGVGAATSGARRWAFGPADPSAAPAADPTSPPPTPSVTSTGGGATMTGAQPGSHVPVQSHPIEGLPAGAIGWQGNEGWGPKETPEQARQFYLGAVGSQPRSPTERTSGSEFEAPAPETPMDARSMGLGDAQQAAFNQIAQGNSARATESAYNRWLQTQGVEQAGQEQRMRMAAGESGLEDAALRRQMLQREGAGTLPEQNIERAKAAQEMLRNMPTAVQDTTGKMVPNPARRALEEQVRTWLSAAPTAAMSATPEVATPAEPQQAGMARTLMHEAVPGLAGGAAMAGSAMIPGFGESVVGPYAAGAGADWATGKLINKLDPEYAAMTPNRAAQFGGQVGGWLLGSKMTRGLPGYRTAKAARAATGAVESAGPGATPAMGATNPKPRGWEYEGSGMATMPQGRKMLNAPTVERTASGGIPMPNVPTEPTSGSTSTTLSGTKEPVRQGFGQYASKQSPLESSDAAMRQKFRNAPAMETAPIVYSPEDMQAYQTVQEGMKNALKSGDLDTFQKLWVELERLHNRYGGAKPSELH